MRRLRSCNNKAIRKRQRLDRERAHEAIRAFMQEIWDDMAVGQLRLIALEDEHAILYGSGNPDDANCFAGLKNRVIVADPGEGMTWS